MSDCSRCWKPIEPKQRAVADPCCGAPDCDAIGNVSHFTCLPPALQAIEDDD